MDEPDIDALMRTADQLALDFESDHVPETAWIAGQLMHFKLNYCRPDLRAWEPHELEEILLDVMPRKCSMEDADIAVVVPTAAALLRWLGSTGRLDAPGDGERLAALVESWAGRFSEAMQDDSRWGMAKRMFSGVDLSGFDPADPTAMQQVMDEFNARPFAERDRILGALPGMSLPPVVLAPAGILAATARDVVWLDRVAVLCDHLGGAGRVLTGNGNLKLADARALLPLLGTGDRMDEVIGDRVFKTRSSAKLPGLDLTVALACTAGFAEDDGRRMSAGPDTALLRDDPAEAALRLFTALLHLGPLGQRHPEDPYGFLWYAEYVDAELPHLLHQLYGGPGLAVEDWEDELWQRALAGFSDGIRPDQLDFAREGLRRGLVEVLQLLVEFASLELLEGSWPHEPSATGAWTDVVVGLTPFGTWCLQRVLSRGMDAPVVGGLVDAAVGDLLRRLPDLPERSAAAELDHWLAAHGPAALVAGLPAAGETARGLAFRALLRLGEPAHEAVASLADVPGLSAWLEVWRVDAQLLAPTPVVEPARLVEVLGAVLELWGAGAVGRWAPLLAADPLPLLAESWRVRSPQTESVLAAVGDLTDDKLLAKAARKALFKHRSVR